MGPGAGSVADVVPLLPFVVPSLLDLVDDVRGFWRVCAGSRCRQREKSGAGKTVRALTRMAVVVSGWRRCGLN